MKHNYNATQIIEDFKEIYNIEIKTTRGTLLMHSPKRGVNISVIEKDMFGIVIDTRYYQYFEIVDNEIKVKRRNNENNRINKR